jgi:hypothetical protein
MAYDAERERRLDELEELMRARAGSMDPDELAAALDAGLAESTAEAERRRVRNFEEWFALEADSDAGMTAEEAMEVLARKAEESSTGDLVRDLELLAEELEADEAEAAEAARMRKAAEMGRDVGVDWDLELQAELRAEEAFERLMQAAAETDPVELLDRLRAASEGEAAAADARRIQRFEEWLALEAEERDGD